MQEERQNPDGAAEVLVRDTIDAVYRNESRRVLATLIRLLGDFDRAEEALQDAFAAAVERWPQDGVPKNPRAWLVSTGRFKAIDAMRRGGGALAPGRGAEELAGLARVDGPVQGDRRDAPPRALRRLPGRDRPPP